MSLVSFGSLMVSSCRQPGMRVALSAGYGETRTSRSQSHTIRYGPLLSIKDFAGQSVLHHGINFAEPSGTSLSLVTCGRRSPGGIRDRALGLHGPGGRVRAIVQQYLEGRLVEHGHAQADRLVVLAAGLIAGDQERRLLRYRRGDFPAAGLNRLRGLVPAEALQAARDDHGHPEQRETGSP